MKTYDEYLNQIKQAELKKEQAMVQHFKSTNPEKNYTFSAYMRSGTEYAVEVMGLMLQDFLTELQELKK